MFTHYNNRQLVEDLEKKLLLYANTNYVENYGQYFNKERYEKFVNIIINKYGANIDGMINQLVRYYKNGIEFKDDKLSFDYSEISMIGSRLYKELFYIDSQTAFSQYLKIVETKLHGDIEWWLDIYFDDENIKNNFLDNATNYIVEHQNKVWITEFEQIDYQRHSWLRRIENIPEKFNNNNELYFWLNEDKHSRRDEALDFMGNSLIGYLLWKVIKFENYNTNQIEKNRILKILDACSNDYITVGTILKSNDIRLNTFLLTQFEYSLFSFLNLYNIDSAPSNLDNEINYTKQWQEMITRQLINVYFKHFYSHNKEQFSEILFRLINSLVGTYFLNTNDFKIENTLFAVFKKISKYQRKSYNGKEYLFDIVIDELIEKQLSILNVDDTFNIENLFILSYFIEHLNAKQKIFERDNSILINKITKGILLYIQSVLSNDNLYIKNLDDLEKINFGLVYELSENQDNWFKIIDINATVIKWQSIIDEEKTKKVLSSNDPKKPKEIVEIYFQILLIIFKHKEEDQIAQILNKLAINFGLNVEYGIFEDNLWKYNQLYVKYIEALNMFDDSLFEDFIEELQKNKRLKDMLKLLSNTVATSRYEKIKNKINILSEDVSEDTISYFDMREAIQYGMHNDFDDLVTDLITLYQDKIEKTGYKNKEKEFYEIVCRKELLDIFYSDVVLDDKFNQLNRYKISFEDKNFGQESKQKRCENYKTFIRALLFFEKEPIKTYKILENLIEKELNSQYLINMLSAYFKTFENDEDKVEKFQYILVEYEMYNQQLNKERTKSLFEFQVLLYGYNNTNQTDKIIQLYQELPSQYKDKIKKDLPKKLLIFDSPISIKNKLVVCVEGAFDIKFLKNINQNIQEYKNIIDLEECQISFIDLGGSRLEKWVKENHLEGSNIVELHIYDSDIGSGQNELKYKKECESVQNRQDNSFCFLTKKREMENYVHRTLIEKEFSIDMSNIIDWNTEDIPTYIFNKGNIKNEIAIKNILNGKLSKLLTKELLEDIGGFDEIKNWFEYIRKLNDL